MLDKQFLEFNTLQICTPGGASVDTFKTVFTTDVWSSENSSHVQTAQYLETPDQGGYQPFNTKAKFRDSYYWHGRALLGREPPSRSGNARNPSEITRPRKSTRCHHHVPLHSPIHFFGGETSRIG